MIADRTATHSHRGQIVISETITFGETFSGILQERRRRTGMLVSMGFEYRSKVRPLFITAGGLSV